MSHSTRAISPIAYLCVLVALIVLTVVTVLVSFLDLPANWHYVIGLSIAMVKASLVGLFFMHLLEVEKTTWAVVSVTIFWLVAVLILLTFSDYGTRSWAPFTPGH